MAIGTENNITLEIRGIVASTMDLGNENEGISGFSAISTVAQGDSRIVAKQPKAVYMHCTAHNLNLVLNYPVSDIIEVKNLIDILERIWSKYTPMVYAFITVQIEIKSHAEAIVSN